MKLLDRLSKNFPISNCVKIRPGSRVVPWSDGQTQLQTAHNEYQDCCSCSSIMPLRRMGQRRYRSEHSSLSATYGFLVSFMFRPHSWIILAASHWWAPKWCWEEAMKYFFSVWEPASGWPNLGVSVSMAYLLLWAQLNTLVFITPSPVFISPPPLLEYHFWLPSITIFIKIVNY